MYSWHLQEEIKKTNLSKKCFCNKIEEEIKFIWSLNVFKKIYAK